MPCPYCNSSKLPDQNGYCPDCGRIASPQSDLTHSSGVQPALNENELYPVQHWRCTWLLLLFTLINALIMAAILAGVIYGLHFYDKLDTCPNKYFEEWNTYIWLGFMALPVLYLFFGFISFAFKWFIKRYELRPKDLRLVKGFLNISTNSTLLESLWGMKLRQNLLQRILGTGQITLFSDDVTSPVLHINDIGGVRKRFKELNRYQEYALDCSNVKVEKDSHIDMSTQVWRYSWLDLIDEIIWGVVITACIIGLSLVFTWGNSYFKFYHLLILPALYWGWLIWTIIDKIFCTTYTLNIGTLVKESGIFHKKIDVYVLCHIKDCEMYQNLWQRIVGDIGNITLYVKWENKITTDPQNGSISAIKKDVLHGLENHTAKYETFKERWLRERHRRQA